MKDKVEIGLIRTGEIAMFLEKYAELIETVEKHYKVRYHGHDDSKTPRELAEWLKSEGYAIEKALWEAHHKGEEYPIKEGE